MTDELIILKSIVEGGEGFFKFEDGYRNMSVYAKGSENKRYWCIADNQFFFGEMGKNYFRTSSPCNKKPANCGVFSVSNGAAQLELFSGSANSLKEGIEKHVKADLVNSEIEQTTFKNEKTTAKEADSDSAEITAKETTADRAEITAQKEKAQGIAMDNQTTSIAEETAEIQSETNTIDEIKQVLGEEKKAPDSYWECNQEYFLQALDKNEPEELLNSLIPGSKWVKINEEDAEYVLGVIFDENEEPMYLCYGFNLPWSEEPPTKLEGYCQWIPIDCAKPHESGYWVIYVNAKTGERIK
ncbi:MAG: hypothetical protein IKB86_01820 [Clostridia bacterium]|nr:hypothetical protein [Clostridia bacterium]